jgi:hypothetical protein
MLYKHRKKRSLVGKVKEGRNLDTMRPVGLIEGVACPAIPACLHSSSSSPQATHATQPMAVVVVVDLLVVRLRAHRGKRGKLRELVLRRGWKLGVDPAAAAPSNGSDSAARRAMRRTRLSQRVV